MFAKFVNLWWLKEKAGLRQLLFSAESIMEEKAGISFSSVTFLSCQNKSKAISSCFMIKWFPSENWPSAFCFSHTAVWALIPVRGVKEDKAHIVTPNPTHTITSTALHLSTAASPLLIEGSLFWSVAGSRAHWWRQQLGHKAARLQHQTAVAPTRITMSLCRENTTNHFGPSELLQTNVQGYKWQVRASTGRELSLLSFHTTWLLLPIPS